MSCLVCDHPENLVYEGVSSMLMHGAIVLCVEHARLWRAVDDVERSGGTIAERLVSPAVPTGSRRRHTRTDPACVWHRRPRTRLGWWLFDRARGRSCDRCVGSLVAQLGKL